MYREDRFEIKTETIPVQTVVLENWKPKMEEAFEKVVRWVP